MFFPIWNAGFPHLVNKTFATYFLKKVGSDPPHPPPPTHGGQLWAWVVSSGHCRLLC